MEASTQLLQAAAAAALLITATQSLPARTQPVLRITAPASIAREVAAVGATFGPAPTPENFRGPAVFTLDTGGVSPNDGCETINPDVKGKIALIVRGFCDFVVKAQNAEAAGASAVVIINNVAGPLTVMSGSGTVNIPVLLVSQGDGFLMAANESSVRLAAFTIGEVAER